MRSLTPGARSGYFTRRAALHALVFAGLWLLLTGGDFGTWYLGVVAVLTATAVSMRLFPEGPGWRWTFGGAARFVPFFVRQSISGGLDVAIRAIRPSMPLDPDLIEYETSLENPTALAFMANIISLLPGTLGTEVKGRRIFIHSLVGERQAMDGARDLETRVADLFGLTEEGGA
ncbi:MAG: Na+/H+ antiporter subunit E [Actinomycetota bacterium]|jgi:multicomponent Na+:H+ antiporter subunit E|nr:Na+/H+ antiporter subunit E [Rubrobacter sp.]MDQ3509749.1 Na+/H+ antiporter subunit E [Actinomycetota bacterium]